MSHVVSDEHFRISGAISPLCRALAPAEVDRGRSAISRPPPSPGCAEVDSLSDVNALRDTGFSRDPGDSAHSAVSRPGESAASIAAWSLAWPSKKSSTV